MLNGRGRIVVRVAAARALAVAAMLIFAVMAGGVAHAAQQTGSSAVLVTVAPVITLSVTTSEVTITGTPGQAASKAIALKVTSNDGWTLQVKSDHTDGKPREWDGTNYVTNGRSMSAALTVSATGGSTVTVSSTNQTLLTGSATGAAGRDLSLAARITPSLDDQALPTGKSYRILLTYTVSTVL